MIGVYEWHNRATNKSYIGSSIRIEKRKAFHLQRLRTGKHNNKHLQAAFDKYGEASFEFRVLEETSKKDVRNVEKFWIEFYNATNPEFGYNHLAETSSTKGYKHTAESKLAISNKLRGIIRSDDTRTKMSKAMQGNKRSLGYKFTDEQRQRRSARMMGNTNGKRKRQLNNVHN